MNEQEMFEQSFKRPPYYFSLSAQEQYRIDRELGILDWIGENLSSADLRRFSEHYTS